MKEFRSKIKDVQGELQTWSQLRNSLEQEYDLNIDDLVGTLEGETNLTEAILEIDKEIFEREAMSGSIAAQIKILQDRKLRIDRTGETLRNIILRAMDISGLPSIKGPFSTISIKSVAPEIKIEDESTIPVKFWIPQDPKIDKKALNDAAKHGEAIPGTSWTNGKISLTIRRK